MQPADSTPSPDKSRQYHRRRIESIERELFGFGITIGTPLAGAEQHTPCHERAQSSGEIGLASGRSWRQMDATVCYPSRTQAAGAFAAPRSVARVWRSCEEMFEHVAGVTRKVAELDCESMSRLYVCHASGERKFDPCELRTNRDL